MVSDMGRGETHVRPGSLIPSLEQRQQQGLGIGNRLMFADFRIGNIIAVAHHVPVCMSNGVNGLIRDEQRISDL